MVFTEQSVTFIQSKGIEPHLKKKYIEERIENRYSEKDIWNFGLNKKQILYIDYNILYK